MPIDVDAVVISNTRLSDDYSVVALAAPEIASLAQPGQFVMIKAAARNRSAFAAAVLDFRRSCVTTRDADRHFAAQQADRRRHPSALRRRARLSHGVPRSAGTAVRAD